MDEKAIAGIVAVAIVGLLVWVAIMAYPRGVVDIDDAEDIDVPFRIQLREATWQELAQLPRVGEKLAKRVVRHREQHGPFSSIESLQDVHGIGPVMVETMRPYLVIQPLTEEEGP